MTNTFTHSNPFVLESGAVVQALELAYTTHGQLNEQGDNVIWVFHALTANSDPADWWPGAWGRDKLLDPEKFFIICVNMPGSCYGSTGPLSVDPATGEPYYEGFPFFTTRDMIRAYQPLRQALGIRKIRLGIGGSMGGQQLLQWAIEEPELFEAIVPIATNAVHSAWGQAFNASQRWCIEQDPTWGSRIPDAGLHGMKLARSMALLSYRHYETYARDQQDPDLHRLHDYRAESYQRYQGEKLARRFNAWSYYALTRSMDSHHCGRGRGSLGAALQQIQARTLVIGITTDQLFPLREQQQLADLIPGASFRALHSAYGHDGFLLETEAIHQAVSEWQGRSGSAKTRSWPVSALHLLL